ncbi:hypothetical protein F5887DRAFT_1180672 [Amanita rubescens]|nr:hypothetical protein F5887DRAFT_1180672 [Amanita rubescens]
MNKTLSEKEVIHFGPKENCTVQSAATAAGGLGILAVSAIPAMCRLHLLSAEPQQDVGRLIALPFCAGLFGVKACSLSFPSGRADGLGNPHTNALPRCQLRRLRDHATELDRIHNLASTSESADLPVALWLDTLCIPVNPSAKAYRKKAIQLLGKTFNEADAVLALDHTSHVMFVFVRRTFQFARPTSKRSRAMQTFVKTLAGLFRNDSNKSIANSIPVETLELKVLFTVQYLVKNLLVEAGNMVKVIWEANEKYYLGVRGEDFGYFLQAGAHKRDLDESQETPEPRKSKFRQSLGRRRPHFVKTSAARQMELPPSPSAPDDILGGIVAHEGLLIRSLPLMVVIPSVGYYLITRFSTRESLGDTF